MKQKKELAECDSTEKHSASFFVMIKIGVALNSPNINTQYVLMSQLGNAGYAPATNCFNTCFIIRSERTLLKRQRQDIVPIKKVYNLYTHICPLPVCLHVKGCVCFYCHLTLFVCNKLIFRCFKSVR